MPARSPGSAVPSRNVGVPNRRSCQEDGKQTGVVVMTEEPRIRLWTWHSPEFSITDGRVELSRSTYLNDPNLPGLKSAYRGLADRLGTDQIIWCYVRPDEHFHAPSIPEIEWEIEIPVSAILTIVDSYVWNKIADIRCSAPGSRRFGWQTEAMETHPHDADARKVLMEQREEDYHAHIPEAELWRRLFLKTTRAEGATALIRHPVPEEYIIAKRPHGIPRN